MSDLSRAWSIENLRLAWVRIRSNPDGVYKEYFRSLYSSYAIADEELLKHLANRLARGVYVPSDSCKIFLPKASGILRPITLLNIEDQIVYQAMANIVADKLFPHVRHRYNKQVFGHLYAGKTNTWFYRKWTEGYRAFNKSAEDAFNSGYVWSASFDLTAFYDSIDYSVLQFMLEDIGVENDFSSKLTEFLAQWTATSTRIYHNHGIPQGPLSSGLLAEVVLKHFDDRKITNHDVKYFRYVDDIRLFAKKEIHLREALVSLDRLSKDVGLFPQSGKIYIHKVTNIDDELKSISSPPEEIFYSPSIDQQALRKRLVELTPRFFVSNPTRFKFLLSKATASSSVLDRLWRIYDNSPHFYPQVAQHITKFKILPKRHAERLIQEIDSQNLYPSIRAAFVKASVGRLPYDLLPKARLCIKPLWRPLHNQADLSDALWDWLNQQNHLTKSQFQYVFNNSPSEWLGMRLHFGANWKNFDSVFSAKILKKSIKSESKDIAISAALLCGIHKITQLSPLSDLNPLAKIVLKELGLIRRANASVCGVNLAIKQMAGIDCGIKWKAFFGRSYRRAETQLIISKGYRKTDVSSWVNSIDVFNDILMDHLHKLDSNLGGYSLGQIGGVKNSTKLKSQYPRAFEFVVKTHEKRLECALSHSIVRNTKKPTGRIKYGWLKTGIKLFKKAIQEIEGKRLV